MQEGGGVEMVSKGRDYYVELGGRYLSTVVSWLSFSHFLLLFAAVNAASAWPATKPAACCFFLTVEFDSCSNLI